MIRGTAINQDGKTSALTVPSGESQKRVIQAALDNARLGPDRISYIEAHGTGTSLGDPIEANSLRQIFGDNRSPVWVGSIKSNIGHLESAAGIAGLIKTILALRNGWIPELVHFEQLNPHIEWRGSAMRTAGKGVAWPSSGATRCAGISSFGFAGTNAHVVVEEAPRLPGDGPPPRASYVLPLSARDAESAYAMARTYADILRRHGDDVGAISRTAACRRSRFRHRFAVAGESAESLIQALETLQIAADRPAQRRGKLAFLFPGQGAQKVGMGLALYAREPVFRDAIERCAAALNGRIPYSLNDILSGEHGDIHDTAQCQPALFSFEWALAEYLSHVGVVPDVMLGHSLGELVAATRAGVMALDDALALVAERGRLMGAAPGQGSMLVAFAPRDEIAEHVPDSLSIAAYNGPTNTVVSGPERDIAACADALARAEVMCRRLSVSHGFHSALMDPVRVEFEQVVKRYRLASGTIPVIANVTGHIAGDLHRSPTYWCDQIRQPVRFSQGLETLVELG
ncbi:MAG: type I polyketide synthase, partial [Myxococcota bacterium]